MLFSTLSAGLENTILHRNRPTPRIALLPLLVAFATASLIAARPAAAQINGDTDTPPVFGTGHDYIQSLNETVNPATGSLSIRVPIRTPKERGTGAPSYAFIYDSNGQFRFLPNFSYNSTAGSSYVSGVALNGIGWAYTGGVAFTNAGMFIGVNPDVAQLVIPGDISASTYTVPVNDGAAGGNPTCTYTTNFTYTDASGGTHPLGLTTVNNEQLCQYAGIVPNSQGGDAFYSASVSTTGAVTVYDYHGAQVYPTFEDRNGNSLNSTGRAYGSSYFGSTASPSSLTVPGLAKPYTFSESPAPATGGSSISLNPVVVNNTQCPSLPGWYSPPIGNPGTFVMSLPNSTQYTFSQDNFPDPNNSAKQAFGMLGRITYPTGATITYTWGLNPQAEVTSLNEPNATGCVFSHDWPAITKRVVSYDGTTPAEEQDFTYTTQIANGNWTTKTTTVTTKDLLNPGNGSFQTVYTYTPGNTQPLEQSVVYKGAGGAVLKTVTKTWQFPDQLIGQCTQMGDSGGYSGIFYQYAPYGLEITDQAEYDYGGASAACQRPSSTPIRETATVYSSSLPDRPQSVKVYGAGTLLSETDYGYDETPVAAASAINHDEANYGTGRVAGRGNMTTITKKSVTGCADAVTKLQYDETGQVVSQTDPCGNSSTTCTPGQTNYTTQFSYVDNYASGSGSPSGNTNAYVTSITSPSTVTWLTCSLFPTASPTARCGPPRTRTARRRPSATP